MSVGFSFGRCSRQKIISDHSHPCLKICVYGEAGERMEQEIIWTGAIYTAHFLSPCPQFSLFPCQLLLGGSAETVLGKECGRMLGIVEKEEKA